VETLIIGQRPLLTKPEPQTLSSEELRDFSALINKCARLPMVIGPRVQAICDYVHNHLTFGYQFAAPTKSAHDVHDARSGVCRDFAHLAVTLCRCMNILAILATLACRLRTRQWTTARGSRRISPVDARHNTPRIGRVLVGRGRDAADVPLFTSFGQTTLARFTVCTDELIEASMRMTTMIKIAPMSPTSP
jgi:transglutaminase-like putative cysteine protease